MASTEPPTQNRETTDRFGKWGRCTATARTTGDRCGQPAMGPHGKCYFHGGASTGPSDPSVLEGNDHAVGNDGGAPELNMNAATAGGSFADLDNLEARLEGDALRWVAEHHWWALKTAREHAPDVPEKKRRWLAREYALLFYQEWLATADFFKRGVGIEREETVTVDGEEHTYTVERLNPTMRRSCDLSARQRRIGDALNLFPIHWD